MREIIVHEKDSGQRLDKFLGRILKEAPQSFIYKMLRKKNIVLNDKKSDGKESIKTGDVIKFYLSDETFNKFSLSCENSPSAKENLLFREMPSIVYEDDNILIVDKPKGMLSQKAEKGDVSLNEICLSYLLFEGKINTESLKTYTPSICNRLDRNTSGLVIYAKTYIGARIIGRSLKDRSLHKYYLCLCFGNLSDEITLEGSLSKDEKSNRVSLSSEGDAIKTHVIPISTNGEISLLKIHLITGKTHQIRAHLASIGNPLIGDYKYGNRKLNDIYKKKYGIESQMLLSYCVEMPVFDGELGNLSGKKYTADIPVEFMKVIKDGNLEIERA